MEDRLKEILYDYSMLKIHQSCLFYTKYICIYLNYTRQALDRLLIMIDMPGH
jgi:hypothetical protein